MLEIAQLSNIPQFLFFVGCGYLSLQFPFGWTATLFAFLLVKAVNPSSVYVAGLSLNSPSCWVVFLLLSSLLLGLIPVIIGKLPKSPLVSWLSVAITSSLVLLFLAGSVFSAYTVFQLSSAFSLDIVVKVIAFLIGAALGAIISFYFFVSGTATVLAFGKAFGAPLLLLAISNILSIMVMLGTYFLVTFPEVTSWTIGIILGVILGLAIIAIMIHVAIFREQLSR